MALAGVLVMAAVTFFTRAVPFLFFRGKTPPQIVGYAGRYIPPIVMTLLVMYSLKDVSWNKLPYGAPEAAAVVLVAVLHLWKRNALLSIFGGTFFYMFAVQSELFVRLLGA